MECLVLKCPKCGHTWLYTGTSTGRVSCSVCNAYVTVRKNIVAAVDITFTAKLVDPEEVLKRMTSGPKKGKAQFASRIVPEMMKVVEPLLKEKKKQPAQA